jgi:hypothetical protein
MKYHPGHHVELYDLRNDPGETRDLSAAEAPRAAQLRERLHSWMKSVPVPIPTANSHFDPAKAFLETKEKQPWNR